MNISKQTFINLNKYMIVAACVIYFIGVFTPVKFLQPGLHLCFRGRIFLSVTYQLFLLPIKTRSPSLVISPHYDNCMVSPGA